MEKAKIKNAVKRIAKKFRAEKLLKWLWNFFRMYVYEKVYIHTNEPSPKCYVVYLFGRQLKWGREPIAPATKGAAQRVFYFKVNREADYTLMCIQHWMNSIRGLNAEFYFVCDNKSLERKILRFICFKDREIRFLRSRRKELKNVVENLYTGYWENATYAHLTPFYHAKENGITQYWTIDADDTMFLLEPHRVAEVLKSVETVANEKEITAISLDIWRSRMLGRHWSLGVVYMNDNVDICHFFEENTDLTWIEKYKELDVAFNADWFFNYLKDSKGVKIETFYVENSEFIHWGDLLRDVTGSAVYQWRKGQLTLPILRYLYKNEELGVLPIADCMKIDIGVSEEEVLDFMENELSIVRRLGDELRRLNGVEHFGTKNRHQYPY